MLTLNEITIHKFKSIESQQTFKVEKDVTILVGMNESGKTAVLQAIAKSNYFDEQDKQFTFNATHDYPRKEKKQLDKSGEDPTAITCLFGLSEELTKKIKTDLGSNVMKDDHVKLNVTYNNAKQWLPIAVDFQAFVENKTKMLGISSATLNERLIKVKTLNDLDGVINSYQDQKILDGLSQLKKYFDDEIKDDEYSPLSSYLENRYLNPLMPKFIYYDEYYALPSRICIEDLQKEYLEDVELKTARALFELSDINIKELIAADNFEDYKAELEATEAIITDEMFKYWKSNTNIAIQFDIDKKEGKDPNQGTRIVEHILDIRVRNNRTKMSLPLRNRSKGFNWFFSFLVWFKKIQEDKDSNYILLLDEPGLNLHASAQKDLLTFINDLSLNYQILYTTHSPFMIDPNSLNRVRTLFEATNGTIISDSLQEKDPNTIFPLQAALGYSLAQNLFISKHNLLVEGVADLIYLQVVSGILTGSCRNGLRDDIVIVPVGGLDKVSTFVSLLRGNELNMLCLLDSSIDKASQARLSNLVKAKIISKSKILEYGQFLGEVKEADIEDMFEKKEYIELFKGAFPEHANLKLEMLNPDIPRIVIKINQHFEIERYNHYLPAKYLLQHEPPLSDKTLDRFEELFIRINELL